MGRWSPQLDRRGQIRVDRRERLDDHWSFVVRIRQSPEYLVPVDRAAAKQAAMVLAHVHVAQHVGALHQRLIEALLLVQHVVCIGVYLDIICADGENGLAGIGQRVVQVAFVAIDHLDT